MIPADKTKINSDFENLIQKFTFFVLFYKLKIAFITSLHLSSLFTNKRAVLLSAQIEQSQFSFPAGFRHEIERVHSNRRQFLAPEKYDTLTSFWYQLTGQKQAPETGQCVITITCLYARVAPVSHQNIALSVNRYSSWCPELTIALTG